MHPLNVIFRGGPSGKLSILIFHRVLEKRDPLSPSGVTHDDFEWQMRLLSKHFNVVPLKIAVARLAEGTLDPRSVSITFDDGYADNYSMAFPILKKYGLHATFFIATGFLDGGIMFNDVISESIRGTKKQSVDASSFGLGSLDLESLDGRITAISQFQKAFKYMSLDDREEALGKLNRLLKIDSFPELMMTSRQVRDLGQHGMSLGGHTKNHPILSVEKSHIAGEEIVGGIHDLEGIAQCKVDAFAYPNGIPDTDFNNGHIDILKSHGVRLALSTAHGVANNSTNLYLLPRFTPWDKTSGRYLMRLTMNARTVC